MQKNKKTAQIELPFIPFYVIFYITFYVDLYLFMSLCIVLFRLYVVFFGLNESDTPSDHNLCKIVRHVKCNILKISRFFAKLKSKKNVIANTE